jgi:hypothetical protein
MTYREIVELERFRIYRQENPKPSKPAKQMLAASTVERMIEAAVSKSEKDLRKQYEIQLELAQKIFFHAGRYAGGARDASAVKAHDEMLYILGD